MESVAAKNFKILRICKDISQKELAEAVGIKRSSVSMIESGNSLPSLKTAYKISSYFGKSIEEIFFDELNVANSVKKI